MEGEAGRISNAYLKRVNEHEAAVRAAEKEAGLQGGRPVEPWRAGFGEDIEITGIAFADRDGRPVSSGTSGEDLVIQIGYRAKKPIDNPVFGVLVHAENGTQITGTNSMLGGLATGVVEGEGIVSVRFSPLPLQQGHFDLTIGINDQHVQHIFDRKDREYELVVRRGDEPPAAGFIRVDGQWAIDSRPGSEATRRLAASGE
jgi:hypothetical protein